MMLLIVSKSILDLLKRAEEKNLRMFKSEFAREFCRSDLAMARSLSNVALNSPPEEEVAGAELEGQGWLSHHNFRQILQRTEKTLGSHLQSARRVSQVGPAGPAPTGSPA